MCYRFDERVGTKERKKKRERWREKRQGKRERSGWGKNAHKVVVESAKAGKFVGAIVGRSDT